jgi:hypothetical protein
MKQDVGVQIRKAIVCVLNETQNDTTLEDLLTRLSAQGMTDKTAAKAAVWQLIANGDVELTSQRTLRIPENYRREFALAR